MTEIKGSNNKHLLYENVRLCRLRVWPNFDGLGFDLEGSAHPPHLIRLVESNSPAAAGGLKILDVILAVNQRDVSESDYNEVLNAIQLALASNSPIELLVVEQHLYQVLKKTGVQIDPSIATVIDTPTTMPIQYQNFVKHQPRTCNLSLNPSELTFGFEVVNGAKDIGAYVQEVYPNTAASRAQLLKNDRIIEIDDQFVDKEVTKSISEKINIAKKRGLLKLYVMDTDTYKYYQLNKLSLESKDYFSSNPSEHQSPSNTSILSDQNNGRISIVPPASVLDETCNTPLLAPPAKVSNGKRTKHKQNLQNTGRRKNTSCLTLCWKKSNVD